MHDEGTLSPVVERNLSRAWHALLWASGGERRLVLPPQRAQIEVTSRCTLACRTCTRLKLPEHGDMSFEDFRLLLDSLGRIRRLWLSGQGEPLLHAELPEMVEYCTHRGIDNTVIHTSGMILEGDVAERLAASSLGELRVSIDGGNADDMEYLRSGSSFQRVLENARAFASRGTVETSFYTVLNRRNHESAPLLPALAAAAGIKTIWFVETVPFRDETNEREIYDRREYQFTSLPESVRNETLSAIRQNAIKHGVEVRIDLKWYRRRCFDPFSKIYIDYRGNVTPCCRIHNEIFVGNVLKDGLEGSWFSDAMSEWRRDLLRHDRHRRICVERCNLGIGRNGHRNP